ncbi:thymidine kinase [Rhodococcus aerolatus]
MSDRGEDTVPDPTPDPTDALSAVPARGGPAAPATGRVRFFHGPMDCGKSTLALQVDHNQTRQGRRGLVLTRHDRSGRPQISSRMGLVREALEVRASDDLREVVRRSWAGGRPVDYVVVDEAQFLTPAQVDQLAELADERAVDAFCFGIATDFRGELFDGSRRLVELADEVTPVQVQVLCWCGAVGRFNARVVHGHVVREGSTVVVADTAVGPDTGDEVRYQVLCRRHHRLGDLGPALPRQDELPLG